MDPSFACVASLAADVILILNQVPAAAWFCSGPAAVAELAWSSGGRLEAASTAHVWE
jgi:hypothetical protein